MKLLKRLFLDYKEFITILPKFLVIILGSIVGSITRKRTQIKYFLMVDVESAFINTTKLPQNSYERDIHDSSLKIAKLAKKYNVKVIFFLDYPEIEIFRKKGKPIDNLISYLDKEGHTIQLHIHPALNNPEESPDLFFYSLKRIKEMLSEGKEIIYNITGKKPFAFRAGGYSVGNWPKIYTALEEEGFLLDSSTFSGGKNLHKSKFNFSNFDNMVPYYSSRVSLNEKNQNKDGIIEFPITTVIKCQNNLEGYFFRFDPIRNIFFLKLFTKYLMINNKTVYINMIYHSKSVFDDKKKETESFKNLIRFFKFLEKNNFTSPTLESILS